MTGVGADQPVRPRAVAQAVIVEAGRVLLVRDAAGLWTWPAAPVGLGETLHAAAARAAAGAGIAAVALAPLLPQDAITRDTTGALAAHLVLFPVLCRGRAGDPLPATARWHDPASAAEPGEPVDPAVAPVAAAALAVAGA